jgi:hypothetical protein
MSAQGRCAMPRATCATADISARAGMSASPSRQREPGPSRSSACPRYGGSGSRAPRASPRARQLRGPGRGGPRRPRRRGVAGSSRRRARRLHLRSWHRYSDRAQDCLLDLYHPSRREVAAQRSRDEAIPAQRRDLLPLCHGRAGQSALASSQPHARLSRLLGWKPTAGLTARSHSASGRPMNSGAADGLKDKTPLGGTQ